MAGHDRRPVRPVRKNCGYAQNGPESTHRHQATRIGLTVLLPHGQASICSCGAYRPWVGDPPKVSGPWLPATREAHLFPRKNARKAYKIARNEGDSGVPEKRIDVLCQCGWGRLKCPLREVPEFCPMCGVDLRELLGDPADRFADDDAPEYVPPPVAFDDDEIVDDDDMNRNGGDKLLRDLKRAADKGDHLARLRYVQEAQRRGVLVPGSGVLKRGDPVTVINEKNKHFGRTGTVVDLNRGTVDVVLDDGTPVSTQRSMLAKGGVVGAFSRRKKNPPIETIQDIQKAWKELIDEGTPPVVAKQIILRELRPPKSYEKDQAGSDRRQSQIREWLDRQSAESRGREEKNKEKLSARNNRSSGRRAVTTQRTKMRRNSLDVLREIDVDGYRLLTWDVHRMRNDRDMIGYRLTSPSGQVIFEGEDIGNSPLDAMDSDETVRAILRFLTLRPRGTDRDYFAGYTPEQMEFVNSDAERLAIYALPDGPPLVDVDGDDSD